MAARYAAIEGGLNAAIAGHFGVQLDVTERHVAERALLAGFIDAHERADARADSISPNITQDYLRANEGLGCQGNSTAELNGVSINDKRSESEFTGTGILSWKPVDDLMLYANYSRGYKAGGFNLDRSALWRAQGDYAAAKPLYQQALAIQQGVGDRAGECSEPGGRAVRAVGID